MQQCYRTQHISVIFLVANLELRSVIFLERHRSQFEFRGLLWNFHEGHVTQHIPQSFMVKPKCHEKTIVMISLLTALSISPYIYGQSARARVYTHKIARPATPLAQRCTSWCHQSRPCVRTPGTKPTGIMCLLVDVVAKVQTPRWMACQQLVFDSSFRGCGLSSLEPPDHENSRRKSSFVTAILLRRWQMKA